MKDEKCCVNCESCSKCGDAGHSMMMLECCEAHKMSKEHLTHKKEMLEKKLVWVTDELKKVM